MYSFDDVNMPNGTGNYWRFSDFIAYFWEFLYIWNVKASPNFYKLFCTHSVKVWWSYLLPNTNGVHFCYIIFRHRAVFPSCNKKAVLEIKSPATLGYTLPLVNISGLYVSGVGCRRTTDRRTQITDRMPKLPTDRHFLEVSETCLYMVHLGLESFFRKLQKSGNQYKNWTDVTINADIGLLFISTLLP